MSRRRTCHPARVTPLWVGAAIGCGAMAAPPTEAAEGGAVAPPSTTTAPVAATPAVEGVAPPATVTEPQRQALDAWLARVGPRRESEGFGDLVVRTARVQLGKPYVITAEPGGSESLRVELSHFECVSLVESTLAVARCVWRGTAEVPCFLAELEAWRYRGGRRSDFASRLHYFPDWIADNESRGRLRSVTGELGGEPQRFAVDFMTRHRDRYPQLRDEATLIQIRGIEERLSATDLVVIPRERVARIHGRLQNGDLIAVVNGLHPGVAVGHAGFVDRAPGGVPRLLHAASYQKRVLVTAGGISDYMLRRPDRQAIAVVRPLPPP